MAPSDDRAVGSALACPTARGPIACSGSAKDPARKCREGPQPNRFEVKDPARAQRRGAYGNQNAQLACAPTPAAQPAVCLSGSWRPQPATQNPSSTTATTRQHGTASLGTILLRCLARPNCNYDRRLGSCYVLNPNNVGLAKLGPPRAWPKLLTACAAQSQYMHPAPVGDRIPTRTRTRKKNKAT